MKTAIKNLQVKFYLVIVMNKFVIILMMTIIIFYLFLIRPRIVFKSFYIEGYLDLKNKSLFNYTEGGIPKIIIKTSWHTRNNMPLQIINAIESAKQMNPDYTVYYFDDDDVAAFMKDYSETAFTCYQKIIPGAFKADLFRVCLLHKYGGCYSDIGHIMLRPFYDICGDANIVLVSDQNILQFVIELEHQYNGIHNALMCSVKEHPFFKKIIDKICENITNNYYGESSLDVTGPMIIGKIFNCYFANTCNYISKDIMVFGTTVYNCEKCKVKILKFVKKLYIFKNTFFIQDYNGNDLVQTKFDDYYYIMYNSTNISRYGDLWLNKKIYNEKLLLPSNSH